MHKPYIFKANKTYAVGDAVTIQDHPDWGDTERCILEGNTELGYQDGILQYVSTGELTYTGKDHFLKNDIILTSTPSKKYVHESSYYGESVVEPLKILDIFGEVFGYKREIKEVRRFVDPCENVLINNQGILEYCNELTVCNTMHLASLTGDDDATY